MTIKGKRAGTEGRSTQKHSNQGYPKNQKKATLHTTICIAVPVDPKTCRPPDVGVRGGSGPPSPLGKASCTHAPAAAAAAATAAQVNAAAETAVADGGGPAGAACCWAAGVGMGAGQESGHSLRHGSHAEAAADLAVESDPVKVAAALHECAGPHGCCAPQQQSSPVGGELL
eukprot:1160493-Pelagomonas_calceolata.AAC.1